jgi:hypothetical protein
MRRIFNVGDRVRGMFNQATVNDPPYTIRWDMQHGTVMEKSGGFIMVRLDGEHNSIACYADALLTDETHGPLPRYL